MKLETETFTTIDYVSFTADEIKAAIQNCAERWQINGGPASKVYHAISQALDSPLDGESFAQDLSAAVSCKVSISKDSSFTCIQALCNLTTDSINVATRELERETRNRFFFLCAYYLWCCFIDDPEVNFGEVKQSLNWLITPLEKMARDYWRDYDKQGRPEFKSN